MQEGIFFLGYNNRWRHYLDTYAYQWFTSTPRPYLDTNPANSTHNLLLSCQENSDFFQLCLCRWRLNYIFFIFFNINFFKSLRFVIQSPGLKPAGYHHSLSSIGYSLLCRRSFALQVTHSSGVCRVTRLRTSAYAGCLSHELTLMALALMSLL